jgi:hypothetical protein
MYYIVSAVLSVMLAMTGTANAVDFQTGTLPTGGNTRLGKIATEHIEQQGINVDFRATGNCSLVKTHWNSTQKPFIAMWTSTNNEINSVCRVPFELQDIIAVLYEFPMALCSLKNQTMGDYTKSGSRHLVGAPGNKFNKTLFAYIESQHNIKHTVVDYRNATEIQAGAKSGEIDWVFMSQPSAEQIGAKCIWSTARDQTSNTKTAKSLWPQAPSSVDYFTSWIVGKNLDSNTELKIKNGLDKAAQSEVWMEFAKKRGYLGFTMDRKQIDIKTQGIR